MAALVAEPAEVVVGGDAAAAVESEDLFPSLLSNRYKPSLLTEAWNPVMRCCGRREWSSGDREHEAM